MKARWYFFGVFEALGPASSACWMGIGLPSCINDPSKELGRAGALLWGAPDWSADNPPGSALRDLSRASSKLPRNWRKSWGALHPPNSPHHVDRAHLISSRARSLPSSRLETIEVDLTMMARIRFLYSHFSFIMSCSVYSVTLQRDTLCL